MLPVDVIQVLRTSLTVRGTITAKATTTPSKWDDGASKWFDNYNAAATTGKERTSRWDVLGWDIWDKYRSEWDNKKTLWGYTRSEDVQQYVIRRAKKQFANAKTFGGQLVCAYKKPVQPYPNSDAQLTMQSEFRTAVELWRQYPDQCRAHVKRLRRRKDQSPYHAWISIYLSQRVPFEFISQEQ